MKALPTTQKLRGGYYTPPTIAHFLTEWAIRRSTDSVLEPACGDGAILVEAAQRLRHLRGRSRSTRTSLTGIELFGEEARKARHRVAGPRGLPSWIQVLERDFFSFAADLFPGTSLFSLAEGQDSARFDAVLGNPPFVRYQDFPEAQRAVAFALMEQHGLRPNRLTNAWLPFLVVSALMLKADGRLAMVIPAELLQVNYAAETRSFLSQFFERITLLTFRKLVFAGTQQDVVLVLAERKASSSHGIRVVELEDAEELGAFDLAKALRVPTKVLDHGLDKWTKYFLTREELHLLRSLEEHGDLHPVKHYLDVDVGLVTGQNDFFVIDESTVVEYDLQEFSERIVGRSANLAGLGFEEADWRRQAGTGGRAFLFAPPNVPLRELPRGARRYIAIGETAKVHEGYKCRIRKHWYVVPSQWMPEAFVLRQVHGYPKLVLNGAQAAATDTIHRVRFTNGMPPKAVASAFVNSLTLAFSEVRGRSYGGGVLTFEPSEVENLPLPLDGAKGLPFARLDKLMRAGDVDAALRTVDGPLLEDGLGLKATQIDRLRGIWQKLRDRRLNRR